MDVGRDGGEIRMCKRACSIVPEGIVMLLLIGVLSAMPAFGQYQPPAWIDISPGVIYTPVGEPSCYTITVGDGAYMTLDLEVVLPWGEDYIYGWPTLDENGQAYVCASADTVPGLYVIFGMKNSRNPWASFTPVWAEIDVIRGPSSPPVITGLGAGCSDWDCIWVAGSGFSPESRVDVVSSNWTHYQSFYGPAWQASPPANISEDGQSLSVQITSPELRNSFGAEGVYVNVLGEAGTASALMWVKAPAPTVYSVTPSCSDLYCLTFSGSFPLNAYVDLRLPGSSEILSEGYTDLVVTPGQITIRLNPNARSALDTSGLNAWVVNPALGNWSSGFFVEPVDRGVKGWFSGISQQGSDYYLYGWACANSYPGSIGLKVYVGGPAGTGAHVMSGTADSPSGTGVAEACESTGGNYGFWLQIPPTVLQQYVGQPIYVYGISPFGLSDLPLNRAGNPSVPGVLSMSHREYIYLGGRLLAVDAQ